MEMLVSEQLEILQKIFFEKISVIYQQEFFLRLTLILLTNEKWFENQLSQIDLLSSLIETSIMSSNPRRALQYICVLDNAVEQLVKQVDMSYATKLEKIL